MTDIRELVPDSHHDLLDAAWATALVTLDGQGRPQTTAVWYLADEDGVFKTSISDARVKFRHLVSNPEVDALIIDPTNQFRTIEIRATATLTPDPEGAVLRKIGAKYDADVATFDQPGDKRYVVSFEPRRVVVNG